MNKRRLIPILLLATWISGCVTIRIETKIDRDGSGTKSYVLALDKSVMSKLESMAEEAGTSAEDIWETAREGAASIKGARIEEYSDDEAEGIKVTVPFDGLEQLEALAGSDAFEGADVVTVQHGERATPTGLTFPAACISSRRSWRLDTRDTSMPYLFPPKATYCHSRVGSRSRIKVTRTRGGHFGDGVPTYPLEAP